MDKNQIIRAWKDEEYRLSLGDHERRMLPAHPSGLVDLSDESLGQVGGYTLPAICAAISVAVATVMLSCAPQCNETLGGTCRNFTSGCCSPTEKL
jgi:mersacidin/lichenicidin family type 2 lantibiotic